MYNLNFDSFELFRFLAHTSSHSTIVTQNQDMIDDVSGVDYSKLS